MDARRLALVPLLALLVGCAGSDPEETAAEPAPASSAAAPSQAPTQASAPSEDEAELVSLTYAGGEVTGDVGRAEVPVGSTVRLSVTSDVVDEIHLHGYDLYLDLAPGQTSQLEFVADVPGIFEVELHDAGTLLTRLQVS